MKKFFVMVVLALAVALSGCQRIETGEVGLRVDFSKQVQMGELQPGSFNQTIVGDVITFQVRDIALPLDDMHPQTSDNSTLTDMDVQLIYSINSTSVGEMYVNNSKAFNAINDDGDIFLMYNYMRDVARSATYKAVAKYPALETVRKRDEIEAEISRQIAITLKEKKLDTSLTITQVQVRNIQPAQSIIDSANEAITEQNKLATATNRVKTAEQEAKRQELLSRPASLAWMKAQTELNYSQAALEGKVNMMIVPHNFTALGQLK